MRKLRFFVQEHFLSKQKLDFLKVRKFENIKLWLADIMMAHSIKYGQVPDRDDATQHTAHTTGTEGQWSIWCMYYVLSLQFFGFE